MRTPFIITAAIATASLAFAPAPSHAALPYRDLRTNTPRSAPVIRPVSASTALVKFLKTINAHYIGHPVLPAVRLQVMTPLRNESGLHAYAQAASNPRSIYYRHFLTPAQIGDAFGTPAAQYAASIAFFKQHGMLVKSYKQRTGFGIIGSSIDIEKTLGIRLGAYQYRTPQGKLATFTAPANGASSLASSIGTVSLGSLISLPLVRSEIFSGGPALPVAPGFGDGRVNGYSPRKRSHAPSIMTARTRPATRARASTSASSARVRSVSKTSRTTRRSSA